MIEINQGVSGDRYVFGYDHARKNFVNWELNTATSCITVAAVEHDNEEEHHGSLAATLREAKKIAARENRKNHSLLRAAMRNETRKTTKQPTGGQF